jgi:NDP-sugar pyrophosphorylase family protein
MVLAAGRGTRLAPLTDTVPKPMVPVAGRPFLEHVLGFLSRGGIREVVINLHHLGPVIEAHVGDGRRFGLTVRYSREDPVLDTGGGIKHAEALLAHEPFLVANGDSLLDVALADLFAFHRARGGMVTMALRPDPDAARFGAVEIDPDDRVRRIVGQPSPPAAVALRPFMFPGLHVLEPTVFGYMTGAPVFSITRDTYPRILAAGGAIYGFVTTARWINIDTPPALAAADRELVRAPMTH